MRGRSLSLVSTVLLVFLTRGCDPARSGPQPDQDDDDHAGTPPLEATEFESVDMSCGEGFRVPFDVELEGEIEYYTPHECAEMADACETVAAWPAASQTELNQIFSEAIPNTFSPPQVDFEVSSAIVLHNYCCGMGGNELQVNCIGFTSDASLHVDTTLIRALVGTGEFCRVFVVVSLSNDSFQGIEVVTSVESE